MDTLLVYILAVWRISSLFVKEAGPFHIFQRLRSRIGIQHDAAGEPIGFPETFWGELFSCVWCFSIWVGFSFTALYFVNQNVAFFTALPFALSGGAIAINTFIEKLKS